MLRRALAAEAATWRNLHRWARRRPPALDPADRTFGYLGVVKPILVVIIVLSVVEIPVLDLIVRNVVPWPPARWIALVLSLWGLLWMFGFLAGIKQNPHVVGPAGIRVRLGTTVDFVVPWEAVASAGRRHRSLPSSRSVQVEDDTLHVVVAGQTSVDLRLRDPIAVPLPTGPSEPVHEIRIYADDPDGLVAEVRASAYAQES